MNSRFGRKRKQNLESRRSRVSDRWYVGKIRKDSIFGNNKLHGKETSTITYRALCHLDMLAVYEDEIERAKAWFPGTMLEQK